MNDTEEVDGRGEKSWANQSPCGWEVEREHISGEDTREWSRALMMYDYYCHDDDVLECNLLKTEWDGFFFVVLFYGIFGGLSWLEITKKKTEKVSMKSHLMIQYIGGITIIRIEKKFPCHQITFCISEVNTCIHIQIQWLLRKSSMVSELQSSS